MDTKSIVFGILLSFAVGFYFGTVSDVRPTQSENNYENDVWKTKVSQIEKRLKEIEEKDIVEYALLRNDKEKFIKSNEIYGRVLQLFMGQLNIKVDVSHWEKLNPSLNIYLEDFNESYEMNKEGGVEFAISPTANPSEEGHIDESLSMWDKITRLVKPENLYNDNGVIAKPNEFLDNSQLIVDHAPMLDIIQGHLLGQISLNNAGAVLDVNMNVDYTYNGKHYTGKTLINLLDEKGKIIVSTKSEGENANFRINPHDQETLIVTLADGSFLQIVYHAIKQTFSGHYYKITSKEEGYQAVGQLTRLSKVP
jgi:hypothetical protein